MSQTPTFAETLRRAMDARLQHMHVSLPAKVTRYDAARLRVDVKPLIKRVYRNEGGARRTEELPVIPEVPVAFPGAGAFRITFPINKNDLVLLVVSEASIDKWLGEKTGRPIDPGDDRRNQLIDAFALPMSSNFATPDAADETDFVLGAPGASDRVARKSDLDSLKTWLDAHTHAHGDPVTGSPSTGSPSPGSSNIKVD